MTQPGNQSLCEPHLQAVRPRPAYYALQALWNPSAQAAAQATFASVNRGIDTTNCGNRSKGRWDCKPYPSQPRLQHRPGTLELYLDCTIFLMRGVCYSPAPYGDASKGAKGADPGYAEPWGDYFTSEWHGIFRRDLKLMQMMGANTIRALCLHQDLAPSLSARVTCPL